jgi:hypothetical protein
MPKRKGPRKRLGNRYKERFIEDDLLVDYSKKNELELEVIELNGRIHTLEHNISLMKCQIKGHKERIKEIEDFR